MNFLAHLHLSGADPELMAGNLMGDFVKGRLAPDAYPPGILRGLRLHRFIDAAAGRNEWFNRSRYRLEAGFGLYRGVLVDLFYDHFLAKDWASYSPVPLAEYLAESHRCLAAHREYLPERLANILPTIFDDLIPSYTTVAGIERALFRMARRIGRPDSPLIAGATALTAHYEGLHADFRSFLPELAAEIAARRQEWDPVP